MGKKRKREESDDDDLVSFFAPAAKKIKLTPKAIKKIISEEYLPYGNCPKIYHRYENTYLLLHSLLHLLNPGCILRSFPRAKDYPSKHLFG